MEKAQSSETLLAGAIAVRKMVLNVRWNKEHDEIGSNGGPSKAFNTKVKPHLGKYDLLEAKSSLWL